MENYILTCCSTVDLTVEHLKNNNIPFACFHYTIDDKEFNDDMGQTQSSEAFYQAMLDGVLPKTSQVGIGEFCDFFRPYLENGTDILHISFSSALSGAYQSAQNAVALLKEEFPERTVYVVDSRSASAGYGMLVDMAAEQKQAGLSLEELRDWVKEQRLYLHHWFFSMDLKWYVLGGRISASAGFIGGVLGICPLLHMDEAGRLMPVSKIRTKKRAVKAMVQYMKENAENGEDYSGKCYISHSYCLEDAQAMAAAIEEAFPKLDGKVQIYNVGSVIGSHTGPGTVAFYFTGCRRDEHIEK